MEGWQRAFVLHSRPERNQPDAGRLHGRVGSRAPCCKRRTFQTFNLKGALQPFTPLLVRFGGRGEVKTLRSAEAVSLALPFLASRFTAVCTSMNSFHAFLNMRLASLNFSSIICIVSGPLLAQPVRLNPPCAVSSWRCWVTGIWRRFSALCGEWRRGRRRDDLPVSGRKGFIASVVIDNNTFTGRQLRALYEREFPDGYPSCSKTLYPDCAQAVSWGKPLKSRELFRQFMPKR